MRRLFAALALASLLVAGCEPDGHDLTVRVQTGMIAGDEVGWIETRLFAEVVACNTTAAPLRVPAGVAVMRSERSALGAGTLGVASFEGLPAGTYTVRARLSRPPSDAEAPPDTGTVLAQRCVVISLRADRVLRIPITSDCLATTCPAASGSPAFDQCLNGRCVDPLCDPSDPDTADQCCDRALLGSECDRPTACRSSSECTATVSCTAPPTCVDGVCVETGEDDCESGQYCDRTQRRCLPRLEILGVDAGPEDAGHAEDATGIDDAARLDTGPETPAPDAFAWDAAFDDAFSLTEICDNTRDDDGDGLLDCEDDACAGNAACLFVGCAVAAPTDEIDPVRDAGFAMGDQLGLNVWLRADRRVSTDVDGRVCSWQVARGTAALRPPSRASAPTYVVVDGHPMIRFGPGQMLTERMGWDPGYTPSLFVATHHVAGSRASLFGFFDGLGTRGRALRYDGGLLTLLANDAQVTTGEPIPVGTAIVSGGYPPSWSDDPSTVWARIDGRVLSPSARGTAGLSPAVARISIGSADSDTTFDVAEIVGYATGSRDDARSTRLEALLSRYRP